MPRRANVDEHALRRLRDEDDAVATHKELLAAGVPMSTICRRMGEDGPWQWILPGVVLLHNGPVTGRQRVLAALKYAGPGAVLTGRIALRARRIQGLEDDGTVHVLVPHTRQPASTEFVVVERTHRPLTAATIAGVPVIASVARAVIDAARHTTRLDEVRGLVAGAVQQRHCTAAHLAAELRLCQRRKTALARTVLTEIAAGIRSVAEARAREIIRRFGIPDPLWNPTLKTVGGTFIGTPDAYWHEFAVALEINSTAWHLSPARQRRTDAKHGRYTRHAIAVLPYSPVDLVDDPEGFARAVAEALEAATPVVRPDIVVVPAEGAAA